MKKILLTTMFVLGLCGSVRAAVCPMSSLATYDAGGFTCNIGDLDFSNFVYTPTGVNPPLDTEVTVKTISGTESGFEFVSGWAAGPNTFEDSLIQYTVTCDQCQITDLVLKDAGAGASGGNGFVNVTETTPTPAETLTVGAAGSTFIPIASVTFSGVTTLDLSKDIHVNGGTQGVGAQVSSVTNLFSTNQTMTPEPSLALLCAGFLCLLPVAKRKLRRGQ